MSLLSRAEASRKQRSLLRDIAASLALVGACALAYMLVGSGGAEAQNRSERCAALFDRYVELRQDAADPKLSPHLASVQLEKARQRALDDRALQSCAQNLRESEATCAESAHSADEFERCFP